MQWKLGDDFGIDQGLQLLEHHMLVLVDDAGDRGAIQRAFVQDEQDLLVDRFTWHFFIQSVAFFDVHDHRVSRSHGEKLFKVPGEIFSLDIEVHLLKEKRATDDRVTPTN